MAITPYERLKKWRLENKKKHYEQQRRYYLAHKERLLDYQREYVKTKNEGSTDTDTVGEVTPELKPKRFGLF